MSQFNSDLEGGGVPSSPRQLSRQPSPVYQPTVDPSYREATFPIGQPVVSKGAQMAAQLEQALHGAGGVVNEVAGFEKQDQREADNLEAKRQAANDRAIAGDEKAQRHQEILDRGNGVEAGRIAHAQLADDLTNGKVPVPLQTADVPAMVDQWMAPHLQGQSPAFAQGFKDAVQAKADAGFYNYRDRNVQAATTETLAQASNQATVATAPEDLARIRTGLKDSGLPGVTDDLIAEHVDLAALHAAAITGDEKQRDAALAGLGNKFPLVQDQLNLKFEATKQKQQNQIDGNFRQSMAAEALTREPGYDGAGPPTPIEVQRKMIQNAAGVSDTAKMAAEHELNTEVAGQRVQAEKSYDQLVFNQAVLAAGPSMDAGQYIPEKIPYKGLDGQPRPPIDPEKLVESVRADRFATIDQAYPPNSKDPAVRDQNLTSKLDWLGKNPSARDPQLHGLFRGVSSAIGPDTTPDKMPPQFAQALTTFQRGMQERPGVITSHMDTRDLEFMRQVSEKLGPEGIPGTTPAAAAQQTAYDMAFPKDMNTIKGKVDDKMVSTAAKGLGYGAGNPMLGGLLRGKMIAYIANGSSPKQAMANAQRDVSQDFVSANGFPIDRRQNPIVDSIHLDEVTKAVVGSFIRDHPDAGYDAENLTLRPDRRSGEWALSIGNGAGVPEGVSLNDADLQGIDRALTQKRFGELAESSKVATTASFADSVALASLQVRMAKSDRGTRDPDAEKTLTLAKTDAAYRAVRAAQGRGGATAPIEPAAKIKPYVDFINNPPKPDTSSLAPLAPGQRMAGT